MKHKIQSRGLRSEMSPRAPFVAAAILAAALALPQLRLRRRAVSPVAGLRRR